MKRIFLPAVFFLLMACNGVGNDIAQKQAPEPVTEAAHDHDSEGVTLDKDRKWKANIETTEGIEKMKALVSNALTKHQSPLELAPGLQQEFATIFEKCTMTGEAHNQLHHYLVPLKGQLEHLKSGNATEVEIVALQHYLYTYSQYFE